MRNRLAICALLWLAGGLTPNATASTYLYTFDTGLILQNLLSGLPSQNLYAVYEVYVRPAVMSDPYKPLGTVPVGYSRLESYDLKGAISPMPFPDSHSTSSATVRDQWLAESDVAAPPQLIGDSNPFVHFVYNPADTLLALATINPNMGQSYSALPGTRLGDSVLNGRTTELMPADRTWGVYMEAPGVELGETVTFKVTAFAVKFKTVGAKDLLSKDSMLETWIQVPGEYTGTETPEPSTWLLTGTILASLVIYGRRRTARH